MHAKAVRFVLSLAAVLVMAASLGFARSWFGKSSTKTYSVSLDIAAKLSNGTELQAGNYTVKIPENTQTPDVEFYSGGKLVAKAAAKVVTQSLKNGNTALEISTQGTTPIVTAVDPAGMAEKVVFSGAGS